MGTALMLNGASPGAPHMLQLVAPPLAADGNWQVSPTAIKAPIVELDFFGTDSGGQLAIPVTDCAVSFDLTMPGLAQTLACPFTLPAGTYTQAGLRFADTFDLEVSDAIEGFYTDPSSPTKLSATMPSGGAQPVTMPNPYAKLGTQMTMLASPLVVKDGDTVTLSILLAALQSIQVNVNAGTLKFGADGNGDPRFPDVVLATSTPAGVAYYVNADVANAYAFTGGAGKTPFSVSVMYSNGGQPAELDTLAFAGPASLTGCGPLQIAHVFPGKGNGYLGMDPSGIIGWASFSDMQATMYSAVMSMQQVASVGQMTTFKCLDMTTDPMPPGDSFTTAPAIPNPTYTTTLTLVAK